MSLATILGLIGDSLTFFGGLILAFDALRRESEFKKRKELNTAVEALKGIKLTKDGITLLGGDSAELVFIRQSVRRSLWGVAILTLGFVSLLAARIVEVVAQLVGHSHVGP